MEWRRLAEVPQLLFSEPSPAPLKYWLWRAGLIDSPEVRMPMVPVGGDLAGSIDQRILLAKPEGYAMPREAAQAR
jgi:4-hydroxy-tetrahydrodipicolinate synthase